MSSNPQELVGDQIDISLLEYLKLYENGSRLTRNRIDTRKTSNKFELPSTKIEPKPRKKRIKKIKEHSITSSNISEKAKENSESDSEYNA